MEYIIAPALRPSDSSRAVIERAEDAISFVRAHAIQTGEIASIRLVRLLKEASTSVLQQEASTALHD